jgi:dihydrolipoamide dehydrogenase
MDYGLWIMDYGLWIMDYGLWIMGEFSFTAISSQVRYH